MRTYLWSRFTRNKNIPNVQNQRADEDSFAVGENVGKEFPCDTMGEEEEEGGREGYLTAVSYQCAYILG